MTATPLLMVLKYVIGVDEAGRGPLAGPVTVAAVLIHQKERFKDTPLEIRDSKKYSPRQRRVVFDYFNSHPRLFFAKSSVFPGTIDRHNIYKATCIAATKAVKKILTEKEISPDECEILLDGSLILLDGNLSFKTIIRGDQNVTAIKAASIVAKVKRDETMVRYHKIFPRYGFDSHKGYGTKKHIKAIKKHGFCKIHRLSFKISG